MIKPLDVTSMKEAAAANSDLGTCGDPREWRIVCKAWSKANGWMKSTKAMELEGLGVLVQVSTEIHGAIANNPPAIAEALQYIPGARLVDRGSYVSIVSERK